MTTKLTLTVEKEIIYRAKVYAKNTGRSLSEIVESYLTIITRDNENPELSDKLKSLIGIITLPDDFEEKEELRSILEKKHL